MTVFQHAQRGAGFQPECLDRAHQLGDFFDVAIFGRAPGRTHAKARGAGVFRALRGLPHFIGLHQLGGFHTGVKAGRLRAVVAVFRAAAGFDGQQGGKFHPVRIKVFPVHGLRLHHQVGER